MASRIAGTGGGHEFRSGDGREGECWRIARPAAAIGERTDRHRDRRLGDPRARRRERRSYRAGAAGRAGERVIIPTGPLKVLVATQPVDFRKGMVGLASLVERELRLDPFSGMLFIFRARRADRIKLLVWDGTGLVLVTKRLHDGKFRWPRPGDGVMKLSAAQASALIEGLDWSRVHVPRVPKPLHVQSVACLNPLGARPFLAGQNPLGYGRGGASSHPYRNLRSEERSGGKRVVRPVRLMW